MNKKYLCLQNIEMGTKIVQNENLYTKLHLARILHENKSVNKARAMHFTLIQHAQIFSYVLHNECTL